MKNQINYLHSISLWQSHKLKKVYVTRTMSEPFEVFKMQSLFHIANFQIGLN